MKGGKITFLKSVLVEHLIYCLFIRYPMAVAIVLKSIHRILSGMAKFMSSSISLCSWIKEHSYMDARGLGSDPLWL